MLSQRALNVVVGIVFALVALGHAARLAFGWPVIFGLWIVPRWISVFGLVFAGYLAIAAFRWTRRSAA